MFTGIVTDIGEIADLEPLNEGLRIKIRNHYDVNTIDIGASIACSGICLTVVDKSGDHAPESSFTVEAWEEALRLTNISSWKVGSHVNLERSLKLGDEMGGHLVSGHVDGLAEIVETSEEGDARRFQLKAPDELARFIARKGSVALNGTSLTVNAVKDNLFDVLIIRHTLNVTTWGERKTGDLVNLEIDQLARYAARLSEFVR
ncbi:MULTISPECIES: riboflavin synthase [Bartonella]|uniref:Riboflavin synthase n=1 Tax=Bartonella choladocola TaxID=2750995 RepID=A0A1U9MGY4_9HYPH|nr:MULTISPECIES: riboflavin synthase [Bartonella]AQT47154.1 riboflavin synthase alpha chain [Bartonella choladocola]MBH9975323.1 riboflavin synthase [Bartonella choladocola]MBI0014930.1 riboflavin synthase [Bartonella sp. B10834G3]